MVLEKYISYLKNNPKSYWFKRKLYGWGWTPATWQGWLAILGYVAGVLLFAFTLDEQSPPQEVMFTFLLPIFLLTVALIRLFYKKGEPPRWQWGFPKDSNK